MANDETVLMNSLLMSMIPKNGTEAEEGLLQLAAEFWLENRRCCDDKTVLPLLSNAELPAETAEQIVRVADGSPVLMCAYLARHDPVDVMARPIGAANPSALHKTVKMLGSDLRPEVAELLVDVDDPNVLLCLGTSQYVPFVEGVRALVRAHNMTASPDSDYHAEIERAADELFRYYRFDGGDAVAGALRLLQDAPGLLSRFEQCLACCTTAVVTDEAVALLRWSSNLTKSGEWRAASETRKAVFNFLRARFGTHTPAWDMFAKLASPDQTIGETVELVLEVETPDVSSGK